MFHNSSFKLFALTLLACAWFFSGGSWNQIARYDSILSLSERGTFCIDGYLPDPEHNINTGDWSHANGHYYSNKAPGSMFLGALAYAPLFWVERLILGHLPGERLRVMNFWWVNFICSALPTALLAAVFYLTLKRLGYSERRSVAWTLALVLATPLWPYAGAMWGHNLAALFLTLAFFHATHLALRTSCSPAQDGASTKQPDANLSPFFVGFFAGLAVVTDYLAIAAIPCFTVFLLCQKRWKVFLYYVLGGILPLALYCFYHWKCFGNPFLPATFFNNPGFLDAEAAGGIVAGFKTNVLLRLLIGMPHGLFWCAPLCIFAIPGACTLWRKGGEHRALGVLAGSWFLISLALNASFNGWHGGSGIGPRYLLPAFPAWMFLAAAAPLEKSWQRWTAMVLGIFAFVNMFVVSSLTPLAEESLFNPYITYWARFLNGFRDLPAYTRIIHPISPGRILVRCQPWSDVIMLGILMFGLLVWSHHGTSLLRILTQGMKKRSSALAHIRTNSLQFVQKNWSVLLAVGLLLLLPSYIGLMGDEAMLQAYAYEANQTLTWAKSGLVGSVGQAYGPIAIWFYQILQMITPNPIHIVTLKTLIVGLSSLAMLRYLARRIRIPARIPALLFLLAPYCWHWTRCLWDNVFQLPLELASLTALVAYLEETDLPTPRRLRQTILLSTSCLCAILAVWLHTMALPFLATLPVFLLVVRRDLLRRDWKRILGVALAGSVLLALILVPRLSQTRQAFATQNTFNRTAKVSVWQGMKNALSFPTLLSSATFEDYQMTEPIPYFTDVWKPLWRILGYAMLAVTICLLVAGILVTWRRRGESIGKLGLFAIINLLMQILFVLATRLEFFPHYHQPVLMSSLLLAAIGAARLQVWRPGQGAWRAWCALGTVSILVFLTHLYLSGGQDRPPYGMTLAEQWSAASTIQRQVVSGQPLHISANTWQYSSLPVCLNILSKLAQEDIIGRKPPRYSPENPPPRKTWVLMNPVPGCGFLRIADTTNPAAPQDVPMER